jgi:hypothetical protein
MKKDKEWFKQQMVRNYPSQSEIDNPDYEIIAKVKIIDEVLSLIDQVNEPELPVIPQFVADWIKECKARKHNLFGVYQFSPELVSVWIFENQSKKERVDLIARAWLDGYTIEKETMYYVIFVESEDKEKGQALYKDFNFNGDRVVSTHIETFSKRIALEAGNFHFTEQEIKAIDERYWAFAVEVTENV